VRVVIVGNGIAGVMVAAKLRALEPDPQKLVVEIYSREPHEYYSRIRLPEVFSSRLAAQDLQIYKPGWYAERNIQVYKNQEAVRIDRGSRKLGLRGGTEVPYDALVLCTGADSFKPPIRNAELDGVFTIREYGDADAIRRYVTDGTRHAVVVGGGLLGLEAARFLSVPGVEDVIIVEILSRLLPRQLDEDGSAMLRGLIEGPRLAVRLSTEVTEFLGERRVRGLRLSDGTEIEAETVLFSAGIAPRTGLAREAGLAVRKGIIVDEQLRTSDPAIFAAGDAAEFQGVVWGIIPAAMDHAPVAAANLLGRGPAAYRQTIPQNTLKVAGISLTSIGKVNLTAEEAPRFEVVSKRDDLARRYEKYVLSEGTLAGCILLGSRVNYGFATGTIGKAVTRADVEMRLW
jgi:nitrite reductase (NADH) large subunit